MQENKTLDYYAEELGSYLSRCNCIIQLYCVIQFQQKLYSFDKCDDSYFACRGKKSVAVETGKCEHLNITLIHESGTWCELYLTASPIYPAFGIGERVIYTIILLPCPRGFSLHRRM